MCLIQIINVLSIADLVHQELASVSTKLDLSKFRQKKKKLHHLLEVSPEVSALSVNFLGGQNLWVRYISRCRTSRKILMKPVIFPYECVAIAFWESYPNKTPCLVSYYNGYYFFGRMEGDEKLTVNLERRTMSFEHVLFAEGKKTVPKQAESKFRLVKRNDFFGQVRLLGSKSQWLLSKAHFETKILFRKGG